MITIITIKVRLFSALFLLQARILALRLNRIMEYEGLLCALVKVHRVRLLFRQGLI